MNQINNNSNAITKSIFYFIAILVVAVFGFPLFWIFSSAFKTHAEAMQLPPSWIPHGGFGNFVEMIATDQFFRYLMNSSIIAIGTAIFVMVLAFPAAYALARFKMNQFLKDNILFFILSTRMLPAITVCIPFLFIFKSVGLIDTHFALILAHTTFNLPVAIWLLKSFISQIPRDIDEAASIDGYTSLETIWHVILPVIRPGVIATLFLVIIFSWNEFMFALMLAPNTAKTLPTASVALVGFGSIQWALISAAVTFMALPIIIYMLITQKKLVQGLSLGAMG